MDLNLGRVLRAENQEERKILIENLFSSQIEPLVKKTIRIKFSFALPTKHDEEDIQGETLLRLWRQLQKWLQDPDRVEVNDFSAYVTATAVNCCKEYIRDRFPRRWHLRNRLRYMLTHTPEFALWRSMTGDWTAGFSSWKEQEPTRQDDLTKWIENPEILRSTRGGQAKLPAIVNTIFRNTGGPLNLDDLLGILIALPGFREQYQQVQMDTEKEVEDLADPRSNLKIVINPGTYLERLWFEICRLPSKQRTALLLNLRDAEGRDAITSFPATGTANISQIAVAIEMPAEELAALWNKLPLDDTSIAERLKLSRQQVINLRKSARERLSYRMKRVAR